MKKKLVLKTLNANFDYLTPLYMAAPLAWAIIRANEIRVLNQVNFNSPVLDIGCGDGLVAKVLLNNRGGKFDYGIDVSDREVNKAKKLHIYRRVTVASVYNLPFKEGSFKTIFSNSVIEHIPDLNKALDEMNRVLEAKGRLVITVPSPYLTDYLMGVDLSNKIHMPYIANLYGLFFNKVFKHYNLYNHQGWKKIFKQHNFRLTNYYYYHSPKLIKMHEMLSFLTLPIHLIKPLTDRWLNPGVIKKLTASLIVPSLWKICQTESRKNEGGSLLLVVEKI